MLYIVATPIGNLKDITERAKEILKSVPYVACEDTRHSQILLKEIKSSAKLLSFHAHSDRKKIDSIIELLKSDVNIALITDAGTPGISDPGGVLVELAHQNNIPVSPVPGPSSVTAAVSVSGMPADQFIFAGYAPRKKGRQTWLKSLVDQTETVVVFESPHRVATLLKDFSAILNVTRKICVCRELTKKFEEVWVGTVGEAVVKQWREQGEFVIVLRGK